MNKLPASTGIDWLKQGLALFRKQPGVLTLLFFTNMLASLLIGGVIPGIGPLLAVILLPSFTMAIMMASHMITNGQQVTPAVLATGFRMPDVKALCKLGLVYLGLFIVVILLLRVSVDDAFLVQASKPIDPKAPPVIKAGDALAVLAISLLHGITLTALSFSAPLTFWKKMPLFKAVFFSVVGIWGALRPVITMLLAWFGMLMAAAVVVSLVSMGNLNLARGLMGALVMLFVLVLQCAMYASFRQIFGDPDAPAAE
ncbi:MAG: BPSS1780 family membrane protein [Pseudomonadota bacterium]